MAALVIALALMAALQLGSASDKNILIKARCDNAPDIDWTETVNAYLRRIPDTINIRANMENTWVTGFKTSAPRVIGLGSLWAYKPPYTFCASNRTVIEVEAVAADSMRIDMDWKSCTGSSGTLGTSVSIGKVRLYFAVEATPEEPLRLRLNTIEPDSLEDPRVYVTGVRPGLSNFIQGLGVVFMPHVQLLWSRFLRVDTVALLRDDLNI